MSFLDGLEKSVVVAPKAPFVAQPAPPVAAGPFPVAEPAPAPEKPKEPASPKPIVADPPDESAGDYDGTVPLKVTRYEKMVQKRVELGLTQAECYITTGKGKISRETATNAASRVFARADVRARLAYLTALHEGQQLGSESDELVSLEDIAVQLSKAVRKGGFDSAFVSACTQAAKIIETINSAQAADLDPSHLAQHLCQFAGMEPAAILQAVGGLRFLLERMCAVLKCSMADVYAASAAPQSTEAQ